MDFLYVANDNDLTLPLVSDSTGLPVNDATVTFAVLDSAFTPVVNASGTMTYVAASAGIYTGVVSASAPLVAGARYYVTFTGTSFTAGTMSIRWTVTGAYNPGVLTPDDSCCTDDTPATLKDMMRNDVCNVFLDTSDFAENITFTPKGGAPEVFTAVVERGEDIQTNQFGDGLVQQQMATVYVSSCCTADIYDTFLIDANTYAVTSRPVNDGFGMKRYELKLSTSKEKSHDNYRMPR